MIDKFIYRIGIDKVTLYNFDFEIMPGENEIINSLEIEKESNVKRIIIKNELCNILDVCYNGEENKRYKLISFNPNKILEGHNIRNSTPKELKKAMEKLKDYLKEKGAIINFENAKIKEIEININIPVNFLEFKETFRALMKPLGKYQEISDINQSEKIKESTELESLFAKINNNTILRIYNKSKESNINTSISRIEFSIKKGSLNYYLGKLGKENNINVLFENENIITDIFKDKLNKIFKKTLEYVEKKKIVLKNEYIAFKNAGRLAKKYGRKEHRGIYTHLEKMGIFDYNILIDIIKTCSLGNVWRETQTVKNKYSHINNIEKLNYLMEFINK